MKLIVNEIVEAPSSSTLFDWGQIRRFIWETGQEDQPYLAVSVSTIVSAFDDDDTVLDARDDNGAAVYAWTAYRTTSFYTSLQDARQAAPSVYDITSLISGEFDTEALAKANAVNYLQGLRPEDFKPETIV